VIGRPPLEAFDHRPRTRVVFGMGSLARLGDLGRELGFRRALIVAHRGLLTAGHVERAAAALRAASIAASTFHDFDSNPDTAMVEAGRRQAEAEGVDSLVGLGGGSSMDCAKGINFVLSGGGEMRDYRGYGLARQSLRPMIGVPTTAGTGSEAQSYALISDAVTHEKMACGDPGAAFRAAILDPELTLSQPRWVTATAGYDALSHAVESYVSTAAGPLSRMYAREAWRLLEGGLERVLDAPGDLEARGAMLLGAHLAGAAIEASMLGAAHACANPLTARYGTIHGQAVSLMLPAVVRFNATVAGEAYGELLWLAGRDPGGHPAEAMAERLRSLAARAELAPRLAAAGVSRDHLPALAAEAATQWTGRFNPRPFDEEAALALYDASY
jgi:alcohol dehydrogenase